jgi:hypothetical protein
MTGMEWAFVFLPRTSMADKILYYPAINLPKSEWTIKSIMYWDEVGVIVPHDFIRTPEEFAPEMRILIQENAVRQHFPSYFDYLQSSISESILRVRNSGDVDPLLGHYSGDVDPPLKERSIVMQ